MTPAIPVLVYPQTPDNAYEVRLLKRIQEASLEGDTDTVRSCLAEFISVSASKSREDKFKYILLMLLQESVKDSNSHYALGDILMTLLVSNSIAQHIAKLHLLLCRQEIAKQKEIN